MSKLSLILGGALVATVLTASGSVLAAELGPVNSDPVFFRGWQFRTDVVQSNVDRYNKEMNGHVDYQTVTGDYPSIMESQPDRRWRSGPDLRQPVVRFPLRQGRLDHDRRPATGRRRGSADMYPNIKEAWSNDDGKLLGLSYFVTTRGLVQVNLEEVRGDWHVRRRFSGGLERRFTISSTR